MGRAVFLSELVPFSSLESRCFFGDSFERQLKAKGPPTLTPLIALYESFVNHVKPKSNMQLGLSEFGAG